MLVIDGFFAPSLSCWGTKHLSGWQVPPTSGGQKKKGDYKKTARD